MMHNKIFLAKISKGLALFLLGGSKTMKEVKSLVVLGDTATGNYWRQMYDSCNLITHYSKRYKNGQD